MNHDLSESIYAIWKENKRKIHNLRHTNVNSHSPTTTDVERRLQNSCMCPKFVQKEPGTEAGRSQKAKEDAMPHSFCPKALDWFRPMKDIIDFCICQDKIEAKPR
ncbi:hypothetical protein SLE2022_050370 [Rubroshorea leprosula]